MVLTIKDNNSESGIVYSGLFGKLANQKDENSWYNQSQSRLSKYYDSLVDGKKTKESKKILADLKNIDETTYDIIKKSEDHNDALKKVNQSMTTMSAGFDAARLKAIAFNAAVNIGVALLSTLVMWGVQQIADSIETAEEKAESAAEALDKYSEAQDKLKSNRAEIDGFSDEYEKLAKGVNDFGKNVSLSSDEFDRYHEITNKIAEMFPEMIQGWDDEGNAIIRYKGNIDKLNEAYENLQDNANIELLKDADDVFETNSGTMKADDRFSFGINGGASAKDVAQELDQDIKAKNDLLKLIRDYITSSDTAKISDIKAFLDHNSWNNINNSFYKEAEKIIPVFAGRNEKEIKAIREYILDMLDPDGLGAYEGGTFVVDEGSWDNLVSNLSKINNQIKSYETELDNIALKYKKIATAYLQSESANYEGLDDVETSMVNSIVQGLDAEWYRKWNDEEQMYDELEKIVTKIKELPSNDKEKFSLALEANTQFNNGEITYTEWKEKVDAILDLFKDKDHKQSFKILFDYDETKDAYNKVRNKLRGIDGGDKNDTKLNGVDVDDILDELTLAGVDIDKILESEIYDEIKNWCLKNQGKSAKEIANYIKKVIDKASNTGTTNKYGELFDDLGDVGEGLSALNKAYKELRDEGGITLTTLNAIYDKFGDNKNIDNYIKKLATAKGNTSEINKILSELTTEQIKSVIGTENLTEANRNYIEALLEENDIENASAVAAKMIADAQADLAIQKEDLTDKTWNKISALYSEATGYQYTTEYIKEYVFQKMLANKKIDTVEDCEELINLANKAGIAGKKLNALNELKVLLSNKETLTSGSFLGDSFLGDLLVFVAPNSNIGKSVKAAKQNTEKQRTAINKRIAELRRYLLSNDTIEIDPVTAQYNPETSSSGKSKTETALENLKKKYEADEITLNQYIYGLKKLKGKATKGSDLYYEILEELNSQKRNQIDNQYERGEISIDVYITRLTRLQKGYKKYTEGWKELQQQINETKLSKYEGQYERGEISINTYIKRLTKLRNNYVKNSEKWIDINEKIRDAESDKLSDYFDKLEYQRDTNQISENAYYYKKLKTAKEYYAKDKKFKEDYQNSIVEVYEYLKEKRKEEYENEKESYEKQIELIEDFYDKQKTLLEEQSDEDDYLDEQSEKRKTINDLKAELARLSADTSEAAKKRIAEINNDLKEAEKELSDFEKDHALEMTLSVLDKAKEDAVNNINSKIKEIDKNIESIEKYSSATYTAILAWAKKEYPKIAATLPANPAKYASGTSSSVGGLAITQENRLAELIGMNTGNGTFTMMTPNSLVWDNEATKFLYDFANKPTQTLMEQLKDSTSSIAKNINIVNNSAYNINIEKGAVVIEGNADKEVLQKSNQELAYTILTELKKYK